MILYRHLKINGEVFYIGIGKNIKRAHSKVNRNKYWQNITNKYDYEVQVLKSDLTWEDACELEIILISYYGRKDLKTGTLCNMTDGGEGTLGRKTSIESNIKRSLKMTGRKFSQNHKDLLRNKKLGTKQSTEQIKNRGILKTKTIVNTVTNETYDSLEILTIKININKETMRKKLNGILKNNTNYKYTGKWQ